MTAPDSSLSFDVDSGTPLPDAPRHGTLLIAYTPGAREEEWSGRAALAIARGLREDGRRVFLCDVALEDPQLHRVAGVENAEGMSDALRYGTSFRRVAHRLEGNLFLAPAGTVAVDAGALRDDPRWETFTGGFSDAGALLVLFGPLEGESMDRLAERAASILVLASPGESLEGALDGFEASTLVLRSDREAPVADDADVAASMEWDDPTDEDSEEDAVATESAHDEVDGGTAEGMDDAVVEVAEVDGEDDQDEVLAVAEEADDDVEILDVGALMPDADEAEAVEWTPEVLDDEPVLEDGVVDAAAEVSEPDPIEATDPLDFADPLADESAPMSATPADDEVVEVIDLTPPDDTLDLDSLVSDVESSPDLDPLEAAEAMDSAEEVSEEEESPDFATPVVAPKRADESGGGRAGRLLVVLLLVVVAVVAAAWFGLIEIPGLPLASADASEPEAAVVTAPAAQDAPTSPAEAAPEPRADVAAYVVALAAFADEASALEEQANWRSVAQDVQFVVAPVEVNEQPWYRLLAGPAPDSATALGIADRLRTAADVVGADWIVREARLAFLLGETRGRDAADQRVSVLRSLGIPAHVLRVPYSDGSEVFRVYAGAYASEAEAAYLEALLREQDITNAPLTERLGSLSE